MRLSVAISGAGIAGPTLAYWLVRAGHEATLIERAPALRTGGYVIDFWGTGYDVAERMGLIDRVRERGYQVEEVRFVDASGRTAGGFSADVFHRMTDGRFTSLARSDLASVIYESVEDRIETLFGQSIERVVDSGKTVEVELANGATRTFDLLVGADGLHSNVRRLVWGEQDRFLRDLGYNVAAFECTGYPHRNENVYVSFAAPGLSISRFSMRGDRTLFLLVFRADRLRGAEPQDDEGRKVALRAVFAHCGWESGAILSALDRAEDIYFDRVSQAVVPCWSRGRTVLAGDAAACVSLLAGEGAGLAMTQAYVLAGEITRASGDRNALDSYEARLRPFIRSKQKSARSFASAFAPRTAVGIWTRNAATKLMKSPALADLLLGGSVKDDFDLPDYEL